MKQRNINYIIVEGVIGAGKTSLARMLGERFMAKVVLERFEDNPFLIDFYRDRERYAFQTQMYFLLSRYRQQQEMIQGELFHEKLVSDYLFAKDRIFASINLSDKELSLYDKVATLLEREIPKPDLVIYLQASTERLMQNITKRGRTYEKSITEEYIRSLNEAYNQFFFRYKDTPLIVINSTEIDFVNNPSDFEDIVERIMDPPVGTIYYKPAHFPEQSVSTSGGKDGSTFGRKVKELEK
jgi:deoxyadenosine/deoxycytidine kinase